VLRAVYLLLNEGYWSTADDAPIRAELCRLAIGLARSLLEAFPGDPEAAGLLTLLLLHDARRGGRSSENGAPIPLPEQDRGRWDHSAIAAATALLEQTLAAGQPGPFQIEAAISALHCRARCAEDTDWREIAALYGLLEALRPTPAVRVNRAFAVARWRGPAAGLALIDDAEMPLTLSYPYLHVVRGALLGELGRIEDARASLEIAEKVARNAHERAQIRARLNELEAEARRTERGV
jgi:RNA polymerase sigma-70 factor (ECF subfamily)